MKHTSLDYVVKTVLTQMEEGTLRKYQPVLQLAIRGFRELSLYASTQVKTKHLPMLPNKAVNLPSDYVKYTKIGLCIDGRVLTLGLDDSLCLNGDYGPCCDPLPSVAGAQKFDEYFDIGYQFSPYFHNGQYVGGVFGYGGGFNGKGYYRINNETNQIQFSSEVPTSEIILEYISDGISQDGTTLIPIEAIEPLVAFIFWKMAESPNIKARLGDIGYWQQRWIVEFRKFKHFQLSFTVDEYLANCRLNVHQGIKR
jgi:hypothetical protein